VKRHYASAASGAKDSRSDKTLPNSESTPPQSRTANGRETAIFVITPQLVFRSTNLAGAELLRPGGCFTIRDGLLDVTDPAYSMTLRNLVLHSSDRGHRVAVECRSHAGPDRIWVASARRLGGSQSSEGLVLIGLRRLVRDEPMLGREAMEMFGLTPAEARLAVQLAAGNTLAEIAETNGVNISTLRAQLRAVYAKTGTSKQSELVSHIWRAASI
jgi:DNA-binding CsgD family transcriptional regulator